MQPTAAPPPPSVLTEFEPQPRERYGLHLLLFLLTFASVTLTGLQWVGRDVLYAQDAWFSLAGLPVGPTALFDGLRFAVPLLFFLTVHEFGHYLAARYHGISVTLPYYIPLPLIAIGTLGAVIRIREPIPSARKLFDVGAAGPLAGFVAALGILLYGLATLPPPTYLDPMSGHEWIHGYIAQHGTYPTQPPEGTDPLSVGGTLLFDLLARVFPYVPPPFELYHYPVVFAGWLGLFFTALNLLPAGQLDGGHVTYSLFGRRWHGRIARGTVSMLLVSGGVGAVTFLGPLLESYQAGLSAATWVALAAIVALLVQKMNPYLPARRLALWVGAVMAAIGLVVLMGPRVSQYGAGMWLFWAFLIVRFIRVDHPPVLYDEPLTPGRRVLGYLCLAILVLCFAPRPFFGTM